MIIGCRSKLRAVVAIQAVGHSSIADLLSDHACGNRDVTETVADISIPGLEENTSIVLKQRTGKWQELRQERLTASAFSSVLGIWGNLRRGEIWEEKLGLRENFVGSLATDWGVNRESSAIQRYQDVTGNHVEYLAFKIYKDGEEGKGWLGASPDGLIDKGPAEAYENGGILEVKCPHNKGKPEFCLPWHAVPYHYIPQIQGLMEILGRNWLHLFVWTLNGSAIFRLERDLEYWALMYEVLSDFWWSSVVPAKESLSSQENVDVNIFKPVIPHKLTPTVIKESKRLSKQALLISRIVE